MRPRLPIILIKWILDTDDRVFLDITQVEISKFNARNPLARIRVRVLEIKVIFAIFVEFGGGDVECNFNFAFVASFLDSFGKEFERFICTRNIWCKTSLISYVDSYTKN
jgi:hypothetical protein